MSDLANELASITTRLGSAYMTEHGQLLCSGCAHLNLAQLRRAGCKVDLVPVHGIVECTLCGASATS